LKESLTRSQGAPGNDIECQTELGGQGVPKYNLGTSNRHASGSRSFSMNFFKDLWGFLKVRKKFWLLPIILTLLFFGALMVFASGSAIAPFIYTIF
jgi:hypothetical protein